jgi:hypothetical protein
VLGIALDSQENVETPDAAEAASTFREWQLFAARAKESFLSSVENGLSPTPAAGNR